MRGGGTSAVAAAAGQRSTAAAASSQSPPPLARVVVARGALLAATARRRGWQSQHGATKHIAAAAARSSPPPPPSPRPKQQLLLRQKAAARVAVASPPPAPLLRAPATQPAAPLAAADAADASAAPPRRFGLGFLPKRLEGLVILNVITLLMASNWSVIKMAAGGDGDGGASAAGALVDAPIFLALRFALAAAVFVPFLGRADARIARAGLQIGCWYASGYITQALALAGTAASRAALLSSFTVVTVPLLAGLKGAHIRPMVWGCAAAALAGTAMLVSGSELAGVGCRAGGGQRAAPCNVQKTVKQRRS